MKEKVEEILARLKPSLGGAEVLLEDADEGIVRLHYYKPCIGNTCSLVVGSGTVREMRRLVIETIEEQLKEKLPEIKEIIIV